MIPRGARVLHKAQHQRAFQAMSADVSGAQLTVQTARD